MENSSDLKGQIVRLPGGVRVRVESIEDDPPRAIARRIDGPLAGQIAICLVSKCNPPPVLRIEERKQIRERVVSYLKSITYFVALLVRNKPEIVLCQQGQE